jgi:hypothetical protein
MQDQLDRIEAKLDQLLRGDDLFAPPNIWDAGAGQGIPRSLLGRWIKAHGEQKMADCIAALACKRPADPVGWASAWLQDRPEKLFVPKDDASLVGWAEDNDLPPPTNRETYDEYRQRLWGLVKERAK